MSLEDRMPTRREVLTTGAGLGVLALGGRAPALWRRAAAAAEAEKGLPILVVIELNGGNDGLNTVIPHADDRYQRARPTLRVEPGKVLRLDDRLGLNPAMKEMHRLWEDGHLAVVQGVGYPNPNRSHFRSMEIWHTAAPGSESTATVTDGWLGRAADAKGLAACHVGAGAVPQALRGRKRLAASIADLAGYRLAPGAVLPTHRGPIGDDLDPATVGEILRRIDDVRARTARLEAVARDAVPESEPGTLDAWLATIGTLIEADPTLRVFYTVQNGFDTHAGQEYVQRDLLRKVSKGVGTFLDGLKARKLDERVVVLVFSEFGRRVAENAQRGTDHGTAGPVLMAGTPVRGGLIGPAPDLADLDDGDLRFAIDFRRVYATVLDRWLSVPARPVLGEAFEPLPLFGT